MSWRAVVWVMQQPGLNPSQRVVLAKLADHASKDGGRAFVAVGTIATWAGLTSRHVRRVLGELINAGWIVPEGGKGRSGGKRPTTYRVIIPGEFENGKPPSTRTFEAPNPDIYDMPTRTFKTLNPDSMSSEPKSNLRYNLSSNLRAREREEAADLAFWD